MSESFFAGEQQPATEALTESAAVAADQVLSVEDAAAEASSPIAVPDQRATLLTAVQNARDLPPGVRDRLRSLVQQAVTLDVTGEPLLATRQVLDLLAQGLPSVLRRETTTAVQRPAHPVGDAFFALHGEDLTDQQAEQIAQQQLQRAGFLRSA